MKNDSFQLNLHHGDYDGDARRITAAEVKYMRRTAGYTGQITKQIHKLQRNKKITPVLDKLLEYKRNWVHVNRMHRNRLPRVMKHYSPTDRRNHGRPLKRFLDTWDRNESTSGPTSWQIYGAADDDDDDVIDIVAVSSWAVLTACVLRVFPITPLLYLWP